MTALMLNNAGMTDPNYDQTSPDFIAQLLQKLQGLGKTKPVVDNSQPNPFTTQEKFNVGLGIGETALKGYLGLRQNRLAEKQFDFQREAYNTNLAATRKDTNRQLEAQYNRSINKDRLGSKEEYMRKWGY